MNHLREAAQQALESLEKIADWHGAYGPFPENNVAWRGMAVVTARESVIALRAALAQQEQEPVAPYAWMAVGGTIWRRKTSEDDVPLYTAPPRRKWQSLSEEEIHDCFQQRHKDKATERRMIALAIEQALRSKNK
jgi:hypothetical protein